MQALRWHSSFVNFWSQRTLNHYILRRYPGSQDSQDKRLIIVQIPPSPVDKKSSVRNIMISYSHTRFRQSHEVSKILPQFVTISSLFKVLLYLYMNNLLLDQSCFHFSKTTKPSIVRQHRRLFLVERGVWTTRAQNTWMQIQKKIITWEFWTWTNLTNCIAWIISEVFSTQTGLVCFWQLSVNPKNKLWTFHL